VTVRSVTVPFVSTSTFTNGQFGMLVSGAPGPDYILQASTNLAVWANLFTTNPLALPFSWTDAGATNLPLRFYRVLLGP
jgi:hypothetical protein